ncbi:MAG: nitroreductase family protein [Bacteroides sp.]|nr:nitroreductase family protein [Prevotella sp.]MCM1408517.1 nitroreductase family protein [Treponema brennaborense]MCM1469322.1 nitroreductase family protein [Bacteroides sp.]
MNFSKLVKKTRSCRRFRNNRSVTEKQLRAFVDAARLTPSGANKQPLAYRIVSAAEDAGKCDEVFQCLGWAGYLTKWNGPEKNERPSGYIIVVHDTTVVPATLLIDTGIAVQTILLAACNEGLGGCFIGNIKKEKLAQVLDLSAQYEILLVIAIGYPKERIVLEALKDNSPESLKYYRDEHEIHHVPKRSLQDVLI